MIKENDVKIEKIIVKYDDGAEKEITKGAVINMTPSETNDETTLNFEFTDFSSDDLITLVYGVTEMGVRMGILGGGEDEK